MELTQDEKNLVISALRELARTQKSDLDRAEKEPDWAKQWKWVIDIVKRNFDMAQKIIGMLEKQKEEL